MNRLAKILLALALAAFFGNLTGKVIAIGAETVKVKREEVAAIEELTKAIGDTGDRLNKMVASTRAKRTEVPERETCIFCGNNVTKQNLGGVCSKGFFCNGLPCLIELSDSYLIVKEEGGDKSAK